MLNKLSIRSKLFLTYAFLVIGVVTLVFTIYYIYSETELRRSAYNSLNQSANNLSAQLELQIQNLDSVTTKVIMSSELKKAFFNGVSSKSPNERLSSLRAISDYTYSIMGPMPLGWQVNIIDQKGGFMSVGNYSYYMLYPAEALKNMKWLDDVHAADGSRVVTLPHPDYWSSNPKNVISIARAFGENITSKKTAIVEVQQNYDSMARFISGFFGQTDIEYMDNVKIFIVDKKGNPVYPLVYQDGNNGETESHYIWKQIQENPNSLKNASIYNRYNKSGGKVGVAYHYSNYTGWTTILVLSENVLLNHVQEFWRLALFLFLLILTATMAISYFVAKSLTNPIRSMFHSIQALSPSELDIQNLSGSNELINLERIFVEMCDQLHLSIEQTISIRSKEMEARMVALQSQMNPHMLYNIISTIHILAEEQGNTKIVEICTYMNKMFQYILSNSRKEVTVRDEIDYIKDYLSLQSVRRGKNLECTIDIDPQIEDYLLPKLIIQPLVENCIKYGTNTEPPWKISITGTVENSIWTMRIEDNGPGFEQDFINDWRNIRSASATGYGSSEANSHGVGLKNTYERLLLFFGEDMIFKLFNLPGGGSCVLLGSICRETDKEAG